MAKQSRSAMFAMLAKLEGIRDDLPARSIEEIFCSVGNSSGNHDVRESLWRMAIEIKIYRLKQKLGYVQ